MSSLEKICVNFMGIQLSWGTITGQSDLNTKLMCSVSTLIIHVICILPSVLVNQNPVKSPTAQKGTWPTCFVFDDQTLTCLTVSLHILSPSKN